MVAIISWSLLDGCCHFLEPCRWLLSFVISWSLLDGCCHFLETSGWLLDAQEIAVQLGGAHNNSRNSLHCDPPCASTLKAGKQRSDGSRAETGHCP